MNQFQMFILGHEATVRMYSFIILILIFMSLEFIWPRRNPDDKYRFRRLNNIILLLINFIAARLIVPLATFDVALLVDEKEIGLFNVISMPLLLTRGRL